MKNNFLKWVHAKRWSMGFCVFLCLSVAVGVWYYDRHMDGSKVKKIEFSLPGLEYYRWDDDPTLKTKGMIKPYETEFNTPEGKNKSTTKFDLLPDGEIKMKRTTTARGKKISEYFYIRYLYSEDAEALHRFVQKSGKKYFGSSEKSFYERCSKSLESAEKNIVDKNYRSDTKDLGVFRYKGWKSTLIGIVGRDKVGEKGEHKKWDNFYYCFGDPKAGIREGGEAFLAVLAEVSSEFLYSDVESFVFNIEKENKRSIKVAEELGAVKREDVLGCYTENTLKKNMVSYELTRQRWKDRWLVRT